MKEKRKQTSGNEKENLNERDSPSSPSEFTMVRNYESRRTRAGRLSQDIRQFFPGRTQNQQQEQEPEEIGDGNTDDEFHQ